MQRYTRPLVDEHNPFYCPAVSAADYLHSLRDQQRNARPGATRNGSPRTTRLEQDRFMQSFTRLIASTVHKEQSSDDESVDLTIHSAVDRCHSCSSGSSEGTLAYPIPSWELEESPINFGNVWIQKKGYRGPVKKRKRLSYSDIRNPAEYARSFQSLHESSFDVSVKREKLVYLTPENSGRHSPLGLCGPFSSGRNKIKVDATAQRLQLRVTQLEDELYGPPTGTESPRGIQLFIRRLDALLPGIRLRERLVDFQALTHQDIAEFLGANGHLNARILTVLRTSEIQSICLTASLIDERGLNISGSDIFPVFSKPNSFLFLSDLSLSCSHIPDSDLVHIHHLPKLSTLLLNNTGIGNEAVFLLMPLKRTLAQLSIACNPNIDDDAVPALVLLSKLSFLSILDTSIGMVGLGRLARAIYDDARIIDIEVPSVCEDYVNSMDTKYLIDPLPPLITNPDVCVQLSAAALKRNLAAHAEKNPRILSAGTKAEMIERLQNILKIRRMDLLVREMVQETEPSPSNSMLDV